MGLYTLGVLLTDFNILNCFIITGSIIVTMTIQGSTGNVTMVTTSICSDVSAGTTVTVGNTTLTLDAYMKVDGKDVYADCASEVRYMASKTVIRLPL